MFEGLTDKLNNKHRPQNVTAGYEGKSGLKQDAPPLSCQCVTHLSTPSPVLQTYTVFEIHELTLSV